MIKTIHDYVPGHFQHLPFEEAARAAVVIHEKPSLDYMKSIKVLSYRRFYLNAIYRDRQAEHHRLRVEQYNARKGVAMKKRQSLKKSFSKFCDMPIFSGVLACACRRDTILFARYRACDMILSYTSVIDAAVLWTIFLLSGLVADGALYSKFAMGITAGLAVVMGLCYCLALCCLHCCTRCSAKLYTSRNVPSCWKLSNTLPITRVLGHYPVVSSLS